MISVDQILVLEEKIESAVAKIAQLTAENDALRSKCAELTNALSAKTEQLSEFQSNQSKIEIGIIKALEQLDSISKRSANQVVDETINTPNTVNTTEQNSTVQFSAPVMNNDATIESVPNVAVQTSNENLTDIANTQPEERTYSTAPLTNQQNNDDFQSEAKPQTNVDLDIF